VDNIAETSEAVLTQTEERKVDNNTVKEWLRRKEKPFIETLSKLGQETELGFEVNPQRSNFGEFTGRHMCAIASAIIEEAVRRKYGDSVDVYSFGIRTKHMDNLPSSSPFSQRHQAVRFKARGEDDEWTVDATYRQFQPKIKAFRIVVFPTANENKIFTYTNSPQTDQPETNKPGVFFKDCLENARSGEFGAHGEQRINELLSILLG
jgi:hypothetical protein